MRARSQSFIPGISVLTFTFNLFNEVLKLILRFLFLVIIDKVLIFCKVVWIDEVLIIVLRGILAGILNLDWRLLIWRNSYLFLSFVLLLSRCLTVFNGFLRWRGLLFNRLFKVLLVRLLDSYGLSNLWTYLFNALCKNIFCDIDLNSVTFDPIRIRYTGFYRSSWFFYWIHYLRILLDLLVFFFQDNDIMHRNFYFGMFSVIGILLHLIHFWRQSR